MLLNLFRWVTQIICNLLQLNPIQTVVKNCDRYAMNELVTTLDRVLQQRFSEYNRMLLNLLKMDMQMIINMANTINLQDENAKNLVTQLNDLLSQFDRQETSQNEEFLYLSFRYQLKEILKKAKGVDGETDLNA